MKAAQSHFSESQIHNGPEALFVFVMIQSLRVITALIILREPTRSSRFLFPVSVTQRDLFVRCKYLLLGCGIRYIRVYAYLKNPAVELLCIGQVTMCGYSKRMKI